MAIVKPRLNDYHGLPFTQEEVDFAIPFLDEDLPLYVDPFLLWKSPSLQDQSLHTAITNSFNRLGSDFVKGREDEAVDSLVMASECNEAGLGDSRKRKGRPIGRKLAGQILSLFKALPQLQTCGFVHFEEIQLLVDNVGKDRVSDIACTFAKSFLIDYTIQECESRGIPIEKCRQTVYDYGSGKFKEEAPCLPVNPETKEPLIVLPKRWLRLSPWINYDDYFTAYFVPKACSGPSSPQNRVSVLTFNRQNYDVLRSYVALKERSSKDCRNDPLFTPIPVTSAKRKLHTIRRLRTGVEDRADKIYEDTLCQLMASLLYPHLDFAAPQSRTDSGVLIRDLVFYNNRSHDFLADIYDQYDCRQIVMELKNVKQVEREHINQLNRYLSEQFGRFGLILTRNPPPRSAFANTVDLWAGQRRCILILDDNDVSMMCELFTSKQRRPVDVIKKKYVEFTRSCPG